MKAAPANAWRRSNIALVGVMDKGFKNWWGTMDELENIERVEHVRTLTFQNL